MGQQVIKQVVPHLTPRMSRKVIGAQARASVAETKKLAGGGLAKLAALGEKAVALGKSPVGQLGSKAFGIALAAGIASYTLTTAILNRIKDAKERKQAAASAAASAYREARLKAAATLGRELNTTEQQQLAAAFKAKLAELNY